jgi:hypothetical protein
MGKEKFARENEIFPPSGEIFAREKEAFSRAWITFFAVKNPKRRLTPEILL